MFCNNIPSSEGKYFQETLFSSITDLPTVKLLKKFQFFLILCNFCYLYISAGGRGRGNPLTPPH